MTRDAGETKMAGPRASGPIGQEIQWRIEAALFSGYIAVMRALPVEWASRLGGALLGWLGPRIGTERTVQKNLRLAFPVMGEPERKALSRAQWAQTGRTFAEVAIMDRLTPASGRVEIINAERLEAIRTSGTPVVFVSGHLANWEIMPMVILDAGIPCQITYRPANNPYVDDMIRKSRARYGVQLFAPKGGDGARELLEGMKRGQSVALMNDQKFNQGLEVSFFGQPVHAAPGPSRLAHRFGTVLQPMSVERVGGARFRVVVHEPIALDRSLERGEAIHRAVQDITGFVEARVRERPSEWFWSHKRFSDAAYATLSD